MLELEGLVEGKWVERGNRFAGRAEVDGGEVRVHVHDPGRLGELLRPGVRVLLLPKKGKKTNYHLIAVWRQDHGWVFAHSGYHSDIAEELLDILPELRGAREYAREVKVGNHRIDFLLEDRLMEVKGCTLFRDDLALFPDAPTKRGREHVALLQKGDILLFLVMSGKPKYLVPFGERDPGFKRELERALERGVHVTGVKFSFNGKNLVYRGRIPVITDEGLRGLAEEVEIGIERFNRGFSPEASAELSALWPTGFNVVFSGVFCISCGVYDYFYDLGQETDAEPVDYTEFWGRFVVRYRML